MKKTRILLVLFLSFIFFAIPLISNATETQDQNDGCGTPTGADSLADVAKFPMYQVFTPSLNKLTKVRLLFSGTNNPTIIMTIKDMSGNPIGSATKSASSGWNDFVFSSNLSLSSGLSYQIQLDREASALISWNYCQPGGYGGGYAVTGGSIIADKDYNFQTYGYSQSTTSPSPTGVVEPPANLEAEDVADDNGGKIKLTWIKSSTSGVEGYRIFRHSETNPSRLGESAEAGKDMEQVSEIAAKNLEYEDSGLENGQEYTYAVRAYKGSSESVDSNIASAKPENNLAPKTPGNLHVVSKDKKYIEVSWDKVDDERLDKYVIRYGESPIDFQNEKEVSKDASNFRADNLKPDTRYYFRIASKSKEGEISGFSDFISEKTDKEKQGLSWVWILSIIIAILAAAGIYLYIAYLKKWWPFVKRNSKSEILNSKQTQNSRPKADQPLAENIQDTKDDDDIKELSGKKGKW